MNAAIPVASAAPIPGIAQPQAPAPATAAEQAAPVAAAAEPNPAAAVIPPQPVKHDLGVLTGMAAFNGIMVPGYDRPWSMKIFKTPARLPGFVWREEQIRVLLMFWFSSTGHALKLIGHTGAGKTELVLQWHAILNLPLVFVQANPKTEAQQLIGSPVASPSGTSFVDGPVITAARYGLSLCVDEWNLIDPGEASGLNVLLEGKPYTIPETGEMVVPRQGFRVFATMNPKTAGYRGRQKQDMANDDRFVDLDVGYMTPAEETPLVLNLIQRMSQLRRHPPDAAAVKDLAERYVKFANTVRKQYMGVSDAANALPCTMSTRTLLRWVEWALLASNLKDTGRFPANQSAAHYALRKVLSNRQEPEVAQALHEYLTTDTGEPETA